MSKNTKKGLGITGILTIVNVVIIIGIALIFAFGPAGAKANAKPALDYLIWMVTFFQVGSFPLSTIPLFLAAIIDLGIIAVIALFIFFIAKKAKKSILSAVNFLLSGAIASYGISFFLIALRGHLGSISKLSMVFVMVVALLIAISFVISLISCLVGIIQVYSEKLTGTTVVREIVHEVPASEPAPVEEEKAEEVSEEPVAEEKPEPVTFTVNMVKEYVVSMAGEEHPVATENKDANGENGPVSNNVGVCNMALTYGKEEVSSILIRLEAEKAAEFKKDHDLESSNFAGSGDYYKLRVNDGTFTEANQLWEIFEASYQYIISKYFKVEDGKYVAIEEEPVEEPTPVVEPEPTPVVEEKQKIVIERVPFVDKVRRSDRDLKDKYDDIKAYLLSYGLKSRISIDGDTYRLHTVKYVHITIAGKKMKIYYALNPNDYLTSTIPVKGASAKKYADVKAYLDVKSDLSVKRAKILIDTVMANAGIEKINK